MLGLQLVCWSLIGEKVVAVLSLVFKFECMYACSCVVEIKCLERGPCLECRRPAVVVIFIKFPKRFRYRGEKVVQKRYKKGEFLQS